jgi:hypothetical protein
VIGYLARVSAEPTDAKGQEELRKIAYHAETTFPGLHKEMAIEQLPILFRLGTKALALPNWNFVNLDGPICRKAINLFGYKLAAALHFRETSNVLPEGGAVAVHVVTNMLAEMSELPEDFLRALGPASTLRMGVWEVSGQFRFASGASTDGSISGHLAIFRESFALMLFAVHSSLDLNKAPPSKIMLVSDWF